MVFSQAYHLFTRGQFRVEAAYLSDMFALFPQLHSLCGWSDMYIIRGD